MWTQTWELKIKFVKVSISTDTCWHRGTISSYFKRSVPVSIGVAVARDGPSSHMMGTNDLYGHLGWKT